ncbi:MAG TPA: exosome complex protein Rrp42 [Nitrososphaerales archaeon]|nr:exosome complex protein Rrp42 [Nitrososphaerales archaeon]
MSAVKEKFVVEQLRRSQMSELLSKGRRLDGRGLMDIRDLVVEANVIEKAEGSARVKLGNTELIAGVKVNLGTPFPDTPDKGLLVVSAEVLPLASPYAEPGPPNEDTIELARVADRGVRESGMIDVSKLVLVEGKSVYAVFVDVSILNVDGNLFDATSYGVVAALLTTKIPKYEISAEGQPVKTEETMSLPIQTVPISVTFAKIGNQLLVDPASEEEAVMDARLTLVSDDRGNICAGQKGQAGTLSPEQILLAASTAKLKGEEIRAQIKRGISGLV